MLEHLELLGNLTEGSTITGSVLSGDTDLLSSLSHSWIKGLAKNKRLDISDIISRHRSELTSFMLTRDSDTDNMALRAAKLT